MGKAAVAILLATYNGEAWLEEQIRSLRAQKHGDWTLFVRDDGSTDRTLSLLRDLAAADARIRIFEPDGERLGASGSFGRLLERVPSADAYFFCDQDDVWVEHKVSDSLALLAEAEEAVGNRVPVALHTDLELVGPRLEPLHPSHKRRMGFRARDPDPFPRLLAQNFVTGCTMVINPALREAALPIPDGVLMHDWWLALLAASMGRLVYWDHATVRYRQHGGNVSGAARPKGAWEGASDFAGRQADFERLMRKRFRQMELLETRLRERAPDSPRLAQLRDFLGAFRRNRLEGIAEGLRQGILMQGPARSLAYYLLLLKKGYPSGD